MTVSAPAAVPTGAPIRRLWPLFVGTALLSLGHGLQGTLVGVRASLEGFDTLATGVIMTSYYVGFIGGTRFSGRALGRVGHVRAFAALASIASVAALTYVVVINPPLWAVMRALTGFCMAGLFVIVESWLNDQADNSNRGRLLSFYMVVTMAAVAGSQLLLAVGPVRSFELFLASSVLVSLALVPIALSEAPAPEIRVPEPISLRRLWAITPTGLILIFLTGISVGALRGMGPVFAADSGFGTGEIALFVASVAIGATVLQVPIGRLSDRVPRRAVMLAVTATAVLVSAIGASAELSDLTVVGLVFVLGGLVIPMYSLAIAYTNDWVPPETRVGAAALLIVVNGAGSILGPITAAAVMRATGPTGLFTTLAATHLTAALYLASRILRRPAPGVDDQTPFVALSSRGAGLAALRALTARRSGKR